MCVCINTKCSFGIGECRIKRMDGIMALLKMNSVVGCVGLDRTKNDLKHDINKQQQ